MNSAAYRRVLFLQASSNIYYTVEVKKIGPKVAPIFLSIY